MFTIYQNIDENTIKPKINDIIHFVHINLQVLEVEGPLHYFIDKGKQYKLKVEKYISKETL